LKLHLVGGFLGSGKTTAIIQAAKALLRQGTRVGVVTNDQGKYLVDTAFMRVSDLPAVEVTGGCFCCNYSDLDSSLDQLIQSARPDVIFAESVGSCADLVATVVKPLLQLKQVQLSPASFSVFADSRLLRRRLRDEPMPFSEDVVYIFDKQLEEAGLIVVNKIDLLNSDKAEEALSLLKDKFPGRLVLAQNALSENGVGRWLECLHQDRGLLPSASLDIDYERYGRGEAQLAWLDEKVTLTGLNLSHALRKILEGMLADLRQRDAAIGHLKFFVQTSAVQMKISFPTLDEAGWETQLDAIQEDTLDLLVNARVEIPAQELRAIFHRQLELAGVGYVEDEISVFHPSQPNPTYRMD
jgi:Ni2+-binding GTPase involved in maturation of urease and hydrogenase